MATRKRIPGCLRCQERHVKCDRVKPTCSSCRNLKYPTVCEYAAKPLRFRQSRYTSTLQTRNASQREVGSARTTSAKDNDAGAVPGANDTTQATPPTSQDDGVHRHSHDVEGAGSGAALTNGQSSVASPPVLSTDNARRYSSSSVPVASIALTPRPSLSSYCPFPSGLSPVATSPDGTNYAVSGSNASIDLSDPGGSVGIEHPSPSESFYQRFRSPCTLTEEIDCKVFVFYVERAGHWIDIGSPEGYFHSYVPQLALSDPLLLAACLSCASHLMYLLGMVEKDVEEYYSARVVSLMIPALSSDKANSSNEALIATVVILRMSEQFLELSSDAQRHLQGATSLFLDGSDWSPVESNLSISCFWTYLRESIRVSFLREQPCPFDFSHLSINNDDMTIPASTDGVWTNRMTFLLIQVGSLCWGPGGQHATAESRRLKDLIDKWKMHLPASFQPWCICENENEPFPHIRYFSPWHVVAWQFYYAAKVMLAVYYPDDWVPKALHDMHRYIETSIVTPTRLLCGLCMSNTTNVGTNLNGSHLMAWCGRFLSGRDEQRCLLNFLTEFSHNTKWPSRVDCARLEETWAKSKAPWMEGLGVSAAL